MTTRRRGWRAWLAAAVSGRAGRIGNAGARPLPPMSVMGQPRRAGRLKPPWRRREGRLHPVCTASTRRLLAARLPRKTGRNGRGPARGPTERQLIVMTLRHIGADRADPGYHLTAGEGPAWWFLDTRMRVKADGARTGEPAPCWSSPPRQVSGRRSAWQASLLRRPGPGG